MPLVLTVLPSVRPVTGSLKITAYSRQLLLRGVLGRPQREQQQENSVTMIVNARSRT